MQIDFTAGGNSDSHVLSGFSTAERLGRWATGMLSSVQLNVPPNREGMEVRIVLMPMTAAGKTQSQTINIIANGMPVHRGQYSGWGEIRAQLPASPNGTVTLQFLHPTPVAPASIGASTDARQLAFLFKQLSVHEPAGVPTPGPVAQAPQTTAPSVPHTAKVSPDVWVGPDGWLFLIGGSNAALRYYTDAGYFAEGQADAWAELLLSRKARLARYGMRYLHLAAPDKISVYPELVRGDLPNRARHPIALVEAALKARGEGEVLVNPLPAFAAHPHRDRLFLKTDTHWWYEAGMAVAELVSRRLGTPRTVSLAGREQRRYRITFDLGSKIDPAVTEEATAVTMRAGVTRIHANELAERFLANARAGKPVVHNGINVVFRNDNADAIDQRLVIFGDSFMDFQDSTATVIFAEQFRETHFVWSPRIDFGYVARVDANVVMTETAERFMIQLPKDDYNLDRDVAQRLAAYPT